MRRPRKIRRNCRSIDDEAQCLLLLIGAWGPRHAHPCNFVGLPNNAGLFMAAPGVFRRNLVSQKSTWLILC